MNSNLIKVLRLSVIAQPVTSESDEVENLAGSGNGLLSVQSSFGQLERAQEHSASGELC